MAPEAAKPLSAATPGDGSAAGGEDGSVRLFVGGARSLELLDTLMPAPGGRGGHENPGAPLRAVAVLPDGSGALAGGDDRAARLWSLATGEVARTLVPSAVALRAAKVIGRWWSSILQSHLASQQSRQL